MVRGQPVTSRRARCSSTARPALKSSQRSHKAGATQSAESELQAAPLSTPDGGCSGGRSPVSSETLSSNEVIVQRESWPPSISERHNSSRVEAGQEGVCQADPSRESLQPDREEESCVEDQERCSTDVFRDIDFDLEARSVLDIVMSEALVWRSMAS